MIRLDLVSGFLGAGKTTWLEKLALADPECYDCVIVNEVAAAGVDGSALGRAFPGRVVPLSGACICCEGAAALLSALHDLVTAQHRRSAPDESSIAIETSGVSDPQAVLRLIDADPVLSANIRVGQVIVLVSAVSAHQELRHRAVAQRQVALADIVYVSRSDLVETEACEAVAAAVRALNAEVAVVDARNGAVITTAETVTIALVSGSQKAGLGTWSTPLSARTSWAEYAVWLHLMTQCHAEGLLRTKAVLPSANGPMLVQSVGGTVLPVVATGPTTDYRAALVLSDLESSRVESSFSAFVPSAEGAGLRS